MKRILLSSLVLALALAAVVSAAPSEGDATSAVALGAKVEDFKLPDAGGRETSLSQFKGEKGTVLIFISTQCPVSNAYNGRMENLASELKARGVNVVGINSNVAETPDVMKQHAKDNGLSFLILKDKGNRIADRFGASVTPEAFFLDSSNRLVYRGRIDNSRNGDSVTSSELRDAVEAVLAGKPVEKTEVRAFGCSIKRG